MGERQSDGGASGRRHVRPDSPGAGSSRPVSDGSALGDAELEARFAEALCGPLLDADAEQRAVTAFLAARDEGLHQAQAQTRTRRRDDWRPREPRRGRLSVKVTLSAVLASVTLGGVAFAAIGVARSSADGAHGGQERTHAVTGAPERSSAGSSAGASAHPGHPGRPDTAKDTLAHCRAYEQVKGRGNALDSTAWQRLLAAAGGEDRVTAYCTAQLALAAHHEGGQGTDGTNGRSGSTGNGQSDTRNSDHGSSGSGGQNAGKSAGTSTGTSGATGGAGNAGKGADDAVTSNANK